MLVHWVLQYHLTGLGVARELSVWFFSFHGDAQAPLALLSSCSEENLKKEKQLSCLASAS